MAIDWGALTVDAPGDPTLLDWFKDHMGITGNSEDTALNAALLAAGTVIEGWLDRAIAAQPVTELFRAQFSTVTLRDTPTGDVTVAFDGEEQTGYVTYLTTSGVTYLSKSGYPIDYPMDWRNLDKVTVSYSAGHDPLPNDLANGVIWTAQGIYSTPSATVPGDTTGEVKSMSIHDVGSMTFDTGGSTGAGGPHYIQGPSIIPDVVQQMLSKHKRMSA